MHVTLKIIEDDTVLMRKSLKLLVAMKGLTGYKITTYIRLKQVFVCFFLKSRTKNVHFVDVVLI